MTDQPAAGGGSGLVLVVEDDRPTRLLLAAVLAEEQVPHLVAATGHEALALATANPPAMVILDMHLPNLQGEAVATALRMQFGRSLPILAMSASDELGAAQRVGAYDFLAKPFDIAELLDKVRRGLGLGNPPDPSAEASPSPADRVRAASARQRLSFEEHRVRQQGPGPRAHTGGAAQG
ncbi:MAG TPA: response regulator [Chloroflexota bacterium]|nr:response regulator [Chloroflexota bacterium]